MEKGTHMGMNRTGIQMSPMDSRAMQQVDPEILAGDMADGEAMDNLRSAFIAEADEGLGSVPVPGTVKGMVTSGVSAMTGNDPRVLLDKLGERLAFERSGTRLYDALLVKCETDPSALVGSMSLELGERLAFERSGTRLYDALLVKCETDPSALVGSMSLDQVLEIRDEELNHFHQLARAIESLGGDPTAQTPAADVTGVEASGLMQVLTDPRTSITQSLHAILIAELADNAAWEMLIALAENQGKDELADEFRISLEEEREHLAKIHRWLSEATLGKVAPSAMLGTGTMTIQPGAA